ncbi:MAG TPA: arginine--tRNA ligase [Candidatus Polarisedimenticolaceae bacterium]|nr:arginine--tRNA ligase [Candidatus Polarisedimenticolaceae bacterium]
MEPLTPEAAFEQALRRAARAVLGSEPAQVTITYPPSTELGDLASPLCFELARVARRPPRQLAQALAAAFVPGDGLDRVEVAGGGYLNAFLDRQRLLRGWLAAGPPRDPAPRGPKTIVEHTNINPNKAAHIGHLRNAVLGDTLVRLLRRLGRPVEVQNYIDDTGVQLADLVVGFLQLRGQGLEQVQQRYSLEELERRGERFDYVAWELYAEVTRWFEADPQRQVHREQVLHALEQRRGPEAELGAYLARRMVQHHLATMNRIGVRYDLLPRESDILALRFWDAAFERLRASGAIHRAESGKNAGCWVMDLPGVESGAGEDQKVIVRSSGTVTYVGKDIAYQLWKVGLLGRDFGYAPFDWSPQPALYSVWTTGAAGELPDHPPFGNGHVVYNVIDARQSYLQRVVTLGLRALGHEQQADRSVHYAYEMVALTPAAVGALFPDQPLSEEDRARPYLEMSGRRGLGVRADDLLDALLDRSRREIEKRNPAMPRAALQAAATSIAVGALRYYMLRFTRNRVVAFDLDAALAFEGETGPYLQYSVVRARNILGKLRELYGPTAVDSSYLAERFELSRLPPETLAEHWNLAGLLSRVDSTVRSAVESLELSTLAKHAHTLAQAFNSFYHRHAVAQEPDEAIRITRSAFVRLYHDGMVDLLALMGLSVPDRM